MAQTAETNVKPKIIGVASAHESVQGRRWYMEDTFIAIDDLSKLHPTLSLNSKYSIYGVFDGHGGKEVAAFCESNYLKALLEDPAFQQNNMPEAIRNSFIKFDQEILKKSEKETWNDGSTAVVAVLQDNLLHLANLGDSEAVLAKKSTEGTYEAILISEKHKPSNPPEKSRIEKSGGRVICGRIFGSLAVARAFGDISFKFPHNKADGDFVSAEPFVNTITLTNDHDFLIIACDGLWDKLSYSDAVEFVSAAKSAGKPPQEIVELLVKHSLDKGSLDNVTTILVFFEHS